MCQPKETCEHPEKLKHDPEKCSPQQIEECHGKTEKHSCCDK
jgi:hypothetical protein